MTDLINSLPLIIHWDIDPTAFTIPFIDWPVRWYGILFVLGLIVSEYVLFYIFEQEGKTKKNVEDLAVYVVIGTIVGARLGHVFFYDAMDYLRNPLDILKVWEGGLASHGGAIGILTAIYLYCRKYKFEFLWIMDRLVIVVCFTGACIRTGNLMNSEILGTITDLPWGFVFENAYPEFLAQDPRHPAQLYEAVYCIFLMGLTYWLWKEKRTQLQNGFIFGIFMVVLFTLRFLDEFLKINQEAFENDLPLNMGQLLSIPFVIAGLYLIFRPQRKQVSTS
ncbi:MAG: prolipoprotein diacylglyceryl transferase [Flavobacteriales bacterium]|nr:prolipoprotein diacylglyceryl transferase [Flavobacteriales bacterium]